VINGESEGGDCDVVICTGCGVPGERIREVITRKMQVVELE